VAPVAPFSLPRQNPDRGGGGLKAAVPDDEERRVLRRVPQPAELRLGRSRNRGRGEDAEQHAKQRDTGYSVVHENLLHRGPASVRNPEGSGGPCSTVEAQYAADVRHVVGRSMLFSYNDHFDMGNRARAVYDYDPVTGRFLVARTVSRDPEAVNRIHIVRNWLAEFEAARRANDGATVPTIVPARNQAAPSRGP